MIRGSLRFVAGSIVGGVVVGGALGAIFWLTTAAGATAEAAATGAAGAGQRVLVPIPAGTAERIAAGTAASAVDLPPAAVGLAEGDTLVVRNDDSVVHRVGTWWISPGAVLELPVRALDAGVFSCTFHPGGTLSLSVARPEGPVSVILPALLLGVPFGAVFGVVGVVFRGLDDEPAAARA